jgi:hypothetical protein
MRCELDCEKRLQAVIAKDRVRVREFFIDFDKLRKGWVGEAAVSILFQGSAMNLIENSYCCHDE